MHPWFALRVKSNFERVVTNHLLGRGLEGYLPTYRCPSLRSKEIERPLFPGYAFCRFDWTSRLPILTVPGVVGIVGIGGTPQCVDEDEMEAVRSVVASKTLVGPWPFLEPGQRVVIERGPLAGVEGVLLRVGNGYRLVVSVSLLRRSIAAEVDRDAVRPILPAPRAAMHTSAGGRPQHACPATFQGRS